MADGEGTQQIAGEEDMVRDYPLCLSALMNICVGIIFVYTIINLLGRTSIYCDHYVAYWLLGAGIAFILITVVGLVVCYHGYPKWIKGYLVVKLLLLVGVVILVALVFEYTSSHGVVEERQWKARMGRKWTEVRRCLADSAVCLSRSEIKEVFNKCCVEPAKCTEVAGSNGSSTISQECSQWDPSSESLCYNCQECKEAVFDVFIVDWNEWKGGWIDISIVVLFRFIIEMICHFGFYPY